MRSTPPSASVGKRINGVRQYGLLYQSQLAPVAMLDASNAVVATFVYATRPNVPDYLVKSGQRNRILSDARGSVRLVVRSSDGMIAQRLDYDEFGRVLVDTNPGFQPFGFAGGLYEPDTGLVRFGARDYDPLTGRWTAKDPLIFGGGDGNLYAYVGNDPVNHIDPSGLWSFPWSDTPCMPFDLPFGPSREQHANRNQNNRCPNSPPSVCGGGAEDDFKFDSTPFFGGKYRGAGGSECAYDSNGNLMPDPNQTFNFHPDPRTTGHGWDDVGAHYWYGGADGYSGQQTTPY